MRNYFYYYWGHERGLTGLEGWDIRAASESVNLSERKGMADYCLKRCRGLTYGSSGMQEYLFFYKQFIVFRVFRIHSVNQRDDLACAISWFSGSDDGMRACFLSDELKHAENVSGAIAAPDIWEYQPEALPEKEFWIHFMVCLRRMIINRSTCYLIVPQEDYRDRERAVISLIVHWLPENMRNEFSAVCTDHAESRMNVRLCLCTKAPETIQGKDVIVEWKQSVNSSFAQDMSEPVRDMLGNIYQKHDQKDVFETELKYLGQLSISLDKIAADYWAEYLSDMIQDMDDEVKEAADEQASDGSGQTTETEKEENTDEKADRNTKSKLLEHIQRQVQRIIRMYRRFFRRRPS